MPRELKNLIIDEVSAVDVPANEGARVLLVKRDDLSAQIADCWRRIEALTKKTTASTAGAATTKEYDMSSISDAIAKALVADPSDSRADADAKTIMKAQLAAGKITAEGVAAELVVKAHAREIAKRDGCSIEVAYCKAIEEHAELYPLIAGSR